MLHGIALGLLGGQNRGILVRARSGTVSLQRPARRWRDGRMGDALRLATSVRPPEEPLEPTDAPLGRARRAGPATRARPGELREDAIGHDIRLARMEIARIEEEVARARPRGRAR